MMFGCNASVLAHMVFLALIHVSKASHQECRTEERQVIMSSETNDVILTLKLYKHDYYVSGVFVLESKWNNRRLAYINIASDKFRRNGTVSVNVTYYERDRPPIESVIFTLHDVRESDSGEYAVRYGPSYMYLRQEAMQCRTLYILEGSIDDYLEDGTVLQLNNFPSLSKETAARMNVTTSWLIGDREVDTGRQQLVDQHMDTMNLTYHIHEQSNRTMIVFIRTFKVSYIESVVFDPPQDTYILAAKEALPSIRCYGNCSPGCKIAWYRGAMIVSDTDVLSYPVDGQTEFLCYVTNPHTVKQLNKTLQVSRMGVISVAFDPKETFYMLKSGEKIPEIRCTAQCLSTCRITWNKNGAKITDDHVLTSRSSGTNGEHTCLVHDAATETNKTKSIFILYEGVFSVAFDPKDTFYMLKPGEKIPDIRCTAECLSTCLITWSKDGAKITDAHILTSRSSDASGEYTCLVHDTATETNQTKSIFIHYEEEASQIAVYLLAALVGVLSVTSLAIATLATCLWRHVTRTRAWTLRKTEENDGGNVEMTGVTEQYEDLQDTGNADNMYDRINPESQHPNQQTVTHTYENIAMAT